MTGYSAEKTRRALALVCAAAMALTMLAGCGKEKTPTPKYDPQGSAAELGIAEKDFPRIAVQSGAAGFADMVYKCFYPAKDGVEHAIAADSDNSVPIKAYLDGKYDLIILRDPTEEQLQSLRSSEGGNVALIAADATVYYSNSESWLTGITSEQAAGLQESAKITPPNGEDTGCAMYSAVLSLRSDGSDGGIRLLRLDGVSPNLGRIIDGGYPGGTYTYAVWRGSDSGATQKLAEWLGGEAGQSLALSSGIGAVSGAAERGAERLPDGAPVANVTVTDNGSYRSGVYVINGDYAYFTFGGSLSVGYEYADCISAFAAKAGSGVKVYNLLVPTNAEFYRPYGRLSESKSQWENISGIYAREQGVITVDAYSELAAHADEYIFFRTDHHWTGLGAYYGYAAFCRAAGMEIPELGKWEKRSKDGFLGSAYNDTGDANLKANPDYVDYYITCSDKGYADFVDRNGNKYTDRYPWSEASIGSNSYGVFIWADNAYYHCNTGSSGGRSAILVKESFGNAFAPFLFDSFTDVYVVDFRYYTGALTDLIKSTGADTVIFLNNTFSANTEGQIAKIAAIAR